jgi:hypothetical protein
MRCTFVCDLKETIAATLLSGLIAGGVAEMTSPSVASHFETVTIAVNRTHKGDRLPQASLPHHPNNSMSIEMAPASPKQTPLGCDPAFSPVADPARASIFKRCMA